jgi:hypothetical protein
VNTLGHLTHPISIREKSARWNRALPFHKLVKDVSIPAKKVERQAPVSDADFFSVYYRDTQFVSR